MCVWLTGGVVWACEEKAHIWVLVCSSKFVCALVCPPKLVCALICAPKLICALTCAPKLICAQKSYMCWYVLPNLFVLQTKKNPPPLRVVQKILLLAETPTLYPTPQTPSSLAWNKLRDHPLCSCLMVAPRERTARLTGPLALQVFFYCTRSAPWW